MKSYKIILLIGCFVLAAAVGLVMAADELTVTTYLQLDNGDLDLTRQINQLRRDQAAQSMSYITQDIQTNTYELLVVAADVATNGYAFFHNITTNADRWIDVGGLYVGAATQMVSFMRLEAGDVGLMRLHPTNSMYAQGGSSTSGVTGVNLEYWVIED